MRGAPGPMKWGSIATYLDPVKAEYLVSWGRSGGMASLRALRRLVTKKHAVSHTGHAADVSKAAVEQVVLDMIDSNEPTAGRTVDLARLKRYTLHVDSRMFRAYHLPSVGDRVQGMSKADARSGQRRREREV